MALTAARREAQERQCEGVAAPLRAAARGPWERGTRRTPPRLLRGRGMGRGEGRSCGAGDDRRRRALGGARSSTVSSLWISSL